MHTQPSVAWIFVSPSKRLRWLNTMEKTDCQKRSTGEEKAMGLVDQQLEDPTRPMWYQPRTRIIGYSRKNCLQLFSHLLPLFHRLPFQMLLWNDSMVQLHDRFKQQENVEAPGQNDTPLWICDTSNSPALSVNFGEPELCLVMFNIPCNRICQGLDIVAASLRHVVEIMNWVMESAAH